MKVAAGDRSWLAARGLGSVREVLAYASPDVAAISRSSDIFRVDAPPGSEGPACVFVKRYDYSNWSRRLKQTFRGTLFGASRARYEYEFLDEMRRRGVPAVRPMAFGEDRVLGFTRATFLITEGEPGVSSLDVYASGALAISGVGVELRRRLAESLGRTIGRMHEAGVRHGGLFWRNILIRETGGDEGWRFWFLDPDRRARLHDGPVPREEAVSDLAEFASSAMAVGLRGGVSRLTRAYRGVSRLDGPDREFVRAVVSRSRGLADAERHRILIADLIGRLRERVIEREAVPAARVSRTMDEFLDALNGRTPRDAEMCRGERRIVLDLRDASMAGGRWVRTVTVCGKAYRVEDGAVGHPDLTIRSDVRVLLAIVNADDNAFSLVRSGGIRMTGDARLLGLLLSGVEI